MSKKIGLQISGQRFNVNVDDEFALYLEEQMQQDFNREGNNDPKKMLHAYVRKTHQLYMQEQEIATILKKIDSQE
jgi:hypothetical protein